MMLSEDTIEKLIQPLIDRQENINSYVIGIIAERVRKIGELRPSDLHTLYQLRATGADIRLINQELAKLANLQVADIKSLIAIAAEDFYLDMKPFYDYRHRSFIPFEENSELQRIVKAIAQQTADTYINLSNAKAFMIRDLSNPKILKPTPLSQTYQTVVDEAIQASQTGIVDYNTAMRRTMQQLIDSGIRTVTYNTESGRRYTQRLDTAVRRNLLDGIRAINQGVADETGKQFSADGKELSVHSNSAPDHEPVQGHQFTNEEYEKLQTQQTFQDITGRTFSAIARPIGWYNCHHFAWSIIVGVTKPNYTLEQLEEFIRQNNKGYTLPNGKHLTMYECTQYQRKLETEVRKAKDGQIMARKLGDTELAKKYQAKINKTQNDYEQFSKACGLSVKKERMTVSGYRKIKS